MVILTPMFRRPSAVIVSPLLSIAELSTQDETSTLVCITHTHAVSKLQKPKANFHLSSCCHGNHLQRTIFLFWRQIFKDFFGPFEWDKTEQGCWIRDLAHLRVEILYFLSSHLSVFIPSLLSDHSFVPLCSFPLYICSTSPSRKCMLLSLYTLRQCQQHLFISDTSVFCNGKAPQAPYSCFLTTY